MISCFVFLSTFCHSKYVVLGKAQPYQGLLQCYSSVLGRNQHSQKLPRVLAAPHTVSPSPRHTEAPHKGQSKQGGSGWTRAT